MVKLTRDDIEKLKADIKAKKEMQVRPLREMVIPRKLWYEDLGAIPPEPFLFYPVADTDIDTAKAVIYEEEPFVGAKAVYKAETVEGKRIPNVIDKKDYFDTQEEAMDAVELFCKQPPAEEKAPEPERKEEKEKIEAPPAPVVVHDKRSAKERIVELIELSERVSANYYAARGSNIIEVLFPYEYEAEIADLINSCKIDPHAPEFMLQPPSFAETQPDFARGIGAFQLYVQNSKQLVTSGYDVIKMLKKLKPKPVLITASTTIDERPLKNALK